MQIDHLELTNFKRFENLSCDFQPGVNLFVGSNMSGKTSVLEAINVALGCFFGSQPSKLQCLIKLDDVKLTKNTRASKTTVSARNETVGSWSRTFNIDKETNDEKGSYPLKGYGKRFFDAFSSADDKTIAPLITYFSTQRLFKDGNRTFTQIFDPARGRRNGYLQSLEDKAIKNILREWLGNAATLRAILKISDIDMERSDLIYDNIESAIKITLIDFLDLPHEFPLKIYTDPFFNNELVLYFSEDERLPLSYYSDGFRNLIYLIIDLVWRGSQLNPWLTLDEITKQISGVVTIDEIDLHLHPKWQAKAIPLLQKLFPKVQFFITTHSPTVVANFDKGTLYVVDENRVKECSEKYFGKDVDAVLRNILGARDRHIKTQEKIDNLYRLIDEDRTVEEINPIISDLTEQLGQTDPDIQRAKSLMEWNIYKKDNPNAIH